jgi:hypothetical protein
MAVELYLYCTIQLYYIMERIAHTDSIANAPARPFIFLFKLCRTKRQKKQMTIFRMVSYIIEFGRNKRKVIHHAKSTSTYYLRYYPLSLSLYYTYSRGV